MATLGNSIIKSIKTTDAPAPSTGGITPELLKTKRNELNNVKDPLLSPKAKDFTEPWQKSIHQKQLKPTQWPEANLTPGQKRAKEEYIPWQNPNLSSEAKIVTPHHPIQKPNPHLGKEEPPVSINSANIKKPDEKSTSHTQRNLLIGGGAAAAVATGGILYANNNSEEETTPPELAGPPPHFTRVPPGNLEGTEPKQTMPPVIFPQA